MAEQQRYIATVDVDTDRDDLGVQKIAFTANPAIIIKGVAFAAEQPDRTQAKDGVKMRIIAPVLVPSEIYRKADGGHTLVFNEEEIAGIQQDFMKRLNNANPLFKKEHTDKGSSPAYILETWIVQDEKTDKANTVFNLDVPAGSWIVIIQVTDRDYYDELVKDDATGLSIEGFLGHKLELSIEQNYADVLVIDGDKVLLLRRRGDADFEPNVWGFPGGKIDPGESAQEAAARELIEETGLTYSEIKPLDVIDNEDGSTTSYFTVKFSDYDGELKLSDEHEEYEFMTLERLSEAPVIMGESERFKSLTNKAKAMADETEVKIALPDGTYTDTDGKTFKVEGGIVVKPEEMSGDEGEEVEMAEEELEDGTTISIEGELKEGAKTTAKDGDHKTKSGKVVTVKDGVVVTVKDSEKEELEEDTSGTPTNTYTKEEVDGLIAELREEFAQKWAEMELKIEGKTEEGEKPDGEKVAMSAEERNVAAIISYREAMAKK